MTSGTDALTEREKETLRLLLTGHDAKSAARTLGLSVHTINERLRDARRKLHASSSREAARMLAEAEQVGPQFLTDKDLGVAAAGAATPDDGWWHRAAVRSDRFVWLGGGMLIMSLIIAAGIFVALSAGEPRAARDAVPASVVTDASRAESLGTARQWIALLDRQRWEESWRASSAVFRSQVSAAQWSSTMQTVRQPLGGASSRTFQNVTQTTTLPGMPAGKYEIIQFATDFAQKTGAVETVVLARDGGRWTVSGYFIR